MYKGMKPIKAFKIMEFVRKGKASKDPEKWKEFEAEMKEAVKNNTRKYAKRQQTFFKRMQNHTYLTPEEATVDRVTELLI